MEQTPNQSPEEIKQSDSRNKQFLGISTSELAGLKVEEIVGNQQAVTMVMHYYGQLSDENSALKNDLNTAKTYFDEYQLKKPDVSIGAGLQFISTLVFSFSINFLSPNDNPPSVVHAGWVLFLLGLLLAGYGLYLTFRKAKK